MTYPGHCTYTMFTTIWCGVDLNISILPIKRQHDTLLLYISKWLISSTGLGIFICMRAYITHTQRHKRHTKLIASNYYKMIKRFHLIMSLYVKVTWYLVPSNDALLWRWCYNCNCHHQCLSLNHRHRRRHRLRLRLCHEQLLNSKDH